MTVIEGLEVIHDEELRAPAMNMALDEALLQSAISPTLRFYRWRAPAVSFGYFSRIVEARQVAGEREVVRRWTGGGIVMHGADLTYAFVLPENHRLHRQPARDIYTLIHGAITNGLRRSGFAATLATAAAPRVSDACFANPVRADVLLDGRKVVGAAQRRTRAGLLQQGSIQLRGLPQQLAREVGSELCAGAREVAFTTACVCAAHELAERKYAAEEWLTRC